jgi:hypothetical protein
MYCNAGRDRTGILIALLLDYVGAAREEIAADYALTEVRLRFRHDAALAAIGVVPAHLAAVRSRLLGETAPI